MRISDGSSDVCSSDLPLTHNLTPIARFVSFSVKGVPPEIMGIGPKEAIPHALKLAGLTLDQIGWIELNEAFAAQSLAVIRDLDRKSTRLNSSHSCASRMPSSACTKQTDYM